MKTINISTSSRSDMVDITSKIQRIVDDLKIDNGVVTVYVPHTTCAVTINEGADPSVQKDIMKELDKVIPWNDNYKHREGNSAAHIKTSLVGSSENIIIENGQIQLGTWQKIFLCEYDGPRTRKVWIKKI
ncbi:MAG: YjbQ family protein [Candidatus Mcinerneyibacterium aminivorans]|uniref:YjbQ family protein n=1 Tax=Candidatus Mcinerneyibacterium aminivorans TaxID=2703815 RepID=A0A5D0MGR3_9BACT|nr:MAG: YjbQ family protein [Candidatus Mcinerneyibacterium aminivorans]